MSKIIKLDSHLTNLIAAGEVIDKVSSVVKELVENSIDALATEIEVILHEGGVKEIVVIDNGTGMDKEDIKMSFIRNATSKIRNQQDLYHINTLGFRGEAIPSIASVSDMTIKSNDGSGGYYMNYRYSTLVNEGITPINKGTIVIVRNLFYNTPARLKYLKALNIELANVLDIMDKLALANPSIRFKVTNDSKCFLQTLGNKDMVYLIGNIYGMESAQNIVFFTKEEKGIKIDGYLIKPTITRARKNSIVLLVNQRSVRNNNIINAIVEGYRDYIVHGRYPIAIISINIDPMLIDVNVHPAKTEIKFSSETELRDLIILSIKENLKEKRIIPIYNQSVSYEKICEQTTLDLALEEEITYPKSEKESFPYLEYVGQAMGTYLIFQNEEGMFLIDQHAAAERINYEYYLKVLGSPSKSNQELLIPVDLELTKKEVLFVMENINIFVQLGFEIDQSGDSSIYLRRVPLWIIENIEEIAEKIIIFIIKEEAIDISRIQDNLAKSISCKKSIKANHVMNNLEIDDLINRLNRCDNPYNCPHGRPTIIKLTIYELEKMFKRIL